MDSLEDFVTDSNGRDVELGLLGAEEVLIES